MWQPPIDSNWTRGSKAGRRNFQAHHCRIAPTGNFADNTGLDGRCTENITVPGCSTRSYFTLRHSILGERNGGGKQQPSFYSRTPRGPSMQEARESPIECASALAYPISRTRPCAYRQGDSSAVACWSKPCGLMVDVRASRDSINGRTVAKFSRFAHHRYRSLEGVQRDTLGCSGWVTCI